MDVSWSVTPHWIQITFYVATIGMMLVITGVLVDWRREWRDRDRKK